MRLGKICGRSGSEPIPSNYVIVEEGDTTEKVIEFARKNDAVVQPTRTGLRPVEIAQFALQFPGSDTWYLYNQDQIRRRFSRTH